MSWIGRFANLFRREWIDRELAEELASHLEEAAERGRSTAEARKAFGAMLRHHRPRARCGSTRRRCCGSRQTFAGGQRVPGSRRAAGAGMGSLGMIIQAAIYPISPAPPQIVTAIQRMRTSVTSTSK